MTRIESVYTWHIPVPCIDHEASCRDQAAVHVPLATHCTPQLFHEKGNSHSSNPMNFEQVSGTSKSLSSCGSGAVPGGSGGPGSGTGLPARCELRKPKTKHCVKIYLVYTRYIPGIY